MNRDNDSYEIGRASDKGKSLLRLRDTFDLRPKGGASVRTVDEDYSDDEVPSISALSQSQEDVIGTSQRPSNRKSFTKEFNRDFEHTASNVCFADDIKIIEDQDRNEIIEMDRYRTTPMDGERAGTPDHVTHTGTRVISGNNGNNGVSRNINPSNLQDNNTYMTGSMRNKVFEMQHEPDQFSSPSRSTSQNDEDTHHLYKNSDDEKCMAHKYIMCLLAMMILLAGIVAIVVVFKSDKQKTSLGDSIPDPITWDECETVNLRIGNMLNFTCRFNTLHEYRKNLYDVDDVIVFDSHGGYVNMLHTYRADGSDRILTIQQGPDIRCSDEGRYRLQFWKNATADGDLLLHTATLQVNIRSSAVVTSLQQVQKFTSPRIGCTDTTEFQFNCSITDDCNNYAVDFTGRRGGRQFSFKYKMSCSSSYMDETGYTTKCAITFTEEEVERYTSLGCKFTSAGRTTRKYLELPTCDYSQNCTSTSSRWYFNCTKNSTELQAVRAGQCSNLSGLGRCFSPGRVIYDVDKGGYYDNEWDCDGPTVPACRLSWCKRGNLVDKTESPAETLCTSFEENSVTG